MNTCHPVSRVRGKEPEDIRDFFRSRAISPVSQVLDQVIQVQPEPGWRLGEQQPSLRYAQPIDLSDAQFSEAPLVVLEKLAAEHNRLARYLHSVSVRGEADTRAAATALAVWCKLRAEHGLWLRTPNASTGPDKQVMLAWDSPHHHLEIELFPEGRWEVYYEDLRRPDTYAPWSAEGHFPKPLPPKIKTLLGSFVLGTDQPSYEGAGFAW